MSSPPQYGQQQGGYPHQRGAAEYQQQQQQQQQQQGTVENAESGQLPPESFIRQIIFSCFATFCCFFPLGCIALKLAIVAQKTANTNKAMAHTLGLLSYFTSGAAVVVGIIATIVLMVIYYPQLKNEF